MGIGVVRTGLADATKRTPHTCKLTIVLRLTHWIRPAKHMTSVITSVGKDIRAMAQCAGNASANVTGRSRPRRLLTEVSGAKQLLSPSIARANVIRSVTIRCVASLENKDPNERTA